VSGGPAAARARALLGASFVDSDAVARRFGYRWSAADRDRLGELGLDEALLEACRETHILFPLPRLSLVDLRGGPAANLLGGRRPAWYETMPFAREQPEPRWCLLRRGIVPGSAYKTYAEQQALLRDEEVPRACEVVLGTLAFYLETGGRLFDRGVLARCRDRVERYGNVRDGGVNVGRFERGGLSIETLWLDYRLHHLGVAGARRLQ
jgi:hypothetical protein